MKTLITKSRTAQAFLPNVDDIKINRSVFFFSSAPLSYLPFLALLYFCFIAWSDFKASRSREIKVHKGDLVQIIDTVFINPVI